MASHQSGATRPIWLAAFQAGSKDGIEACYREYFNTVDSAVGSVLQGADRDTVVHEVFYKLLTRPDVRQSFTGASLGSWLRSIARNHALDFVRRRNREVPSSEAVGDDEQVASPENAIAAKQILEKFRRRLPRKLHRVFQARFVDQRSQREAADLLRIPRTTLAYHERCIRSQIHKFAVDLEA